MISGSAWLLDLTRMVSRLGQGPMTGIDRVELAYLTYFLAQPEPFFALVRTALGFVVLDNFGARGIFDRAIGEVPLGRADLLGLLTQRHLPQRVRAEADIRRIAMARCLPVRLAATLRRVLPTGTTYVNVGHTNLSRRVMQAVKSVPGAAIQVMVHDTISLDHPQLCRPDTLRVFRQKLASVSAYADLVVHTANCTRAQTDRHFANHGRVPNGVVAHLGVTVAKPDMSGLGNGNVPYYVALGTIEPRKNIELLVKVWQELRRLAGPLPHLYIVGNRGWASEALFDDLDRLVSEGSVTLLHRLGDSSVAALLRGAEALLFPSLAEGYGLPPVEAAALGVPVIAAKLPVVVEMLGDYPVYLDSSDVYGWIGTINHQMRHRTTKAEANRQFLVPPSWVDHFEIVFRQA